MFCVLIRPLKIEDATTSWKWRNVPKVWKLTQGRPNIEITYEIEKEWLSKVLKEKNSKRFAILVDEQYVGNIQLTDIVENKQGTYHIFIGDKSFWGKGIAALATYQILKYAKDVLKLEKVYLTVNSSNLAAIKVYEKVGFIKENDDIKMSCDLALLKRPTVSVFMMVYNHEPYIREAIEGILMQKCSFDFDIVVGEDCSKDNSRKIILEYADTYPGKFSLLLHKTNVGAAKNQELTLAACKGDFIAICEGDDYWLHSGKLQKQVNFLEEHTQCSHCFHAAEHIYKDKSKNYIQRASNRNSFFTVKDVIIKGGSFIPTASMFFRNEGLNELPGWLSTAPVGDYPLAIILSTYGKVGYINEVMSAYRKEVEGSWSSGETTFRRIRKVNSSIHKLLFKINGWASYRYVWPIIQKIGIDYFYLIRAYFYFKLKKNKIGNRLLLTIKRSIN